jgi:F0F1-type ATP synthase membrane subunit c/vacuolar-type H+-ATPase subunit K
MKKIIDWVRGLLRDERGDPSSKRFIGIIAGLTLCVALFINLYTEYPVEPTLVNAVAAICIGGLGLSSADKIWGKRIIKKATEEPNQINS